jgi:hypothetical protein
VPRRGITITVDERTLAAAIASLADAGDHEAADELRRARENAEAIAKLRADAEDRELGG